MNVSYIVLMNLSDPLNIDLARDSQGYLWIFDNLDDANRFISDLEAQQNTKARAVAI